MAISKDSRSRRRKRPPKGGGNSIRTHPTFVSKGRGEIEPGGPTKADLSPANLITELAEISQRLKIAVATLVTVGQALRNQNAELDQDFADCLRWTVTDRLFELSRHIENLVGRKGLRMPESAR